MSSSAPLVARGDQCRELVADAEGRLVALDALDGIALVDEVPVGLGSFASRSDGRAHGHLHDGMQLPPLRDTVYARRRTQADVGDARASPNDRRPQLVSGGRDLRAGISGSRDDSSQRSTSSEPPGSPGLAPCPGAGCRGVIGPEPSTSPDVERTCPRPPGSIQQPGQEAVRSASLLRRISRSARGRAASDAHAGPLPCSAGGPPGSGTGVTDPAALPLA